MEFLCGFGFAVYSLVLIYCIVMILIYNEKIHKLDKKIKTLERNYNDLFSSLNSLQSKLNSKSEGKHMKLFEGERANGD